MTASIFRITHYPVLVWFARGGLGIALLALAASARELFVIVPAILAALVAFRGCPMCWMLGLFGQLSKMFRPIEGKTES